MMNLKQALGAAALMAVAALPLNAQKPQPHPQPAKPAAAAQKPMDMAAMHCGGGMMEMQHMQGMPNMPNMAGMEMMMGPPIPAMVLHHKADIKLNVAQVTKLEALQKQAEPECKVHFEAAMAAHEAANKLLDAPKPDFNAYDAKLKEAANHMVEGMMVMAKAGVAARDVMTPAQRQELKTSMEKMHKPK